MTKKQRNMNTAIEVLVKHRNILVENRDAIITKLNEDILKIEAAIEQLSGNKVWLTEGETRYDDQHTDYIKGSLEEM